MRERNDFNMLYKLYRLLHLNTLKSIIRFWFILLIVLFIVLIYLPFSLFAKEYREAEAHDHIQQMMNLQELAIENWFNDRMSLIQTISQLPTIKGLEKEEMKQILNTFVENHDDFSGIVFVNEQGLSEIDTTGLLDIDLSDRLYFQEAKKGNPYVSDVLIGRQSHEKIIIFSSPIFDYEQRFRGLIFGSVRLDAVNDIMKNFHLSEAGHTYLVNREGMLLTELRFSNEKGDKESIVSNSIIDTEIFHQANERKEITKSYMNNQGSTVFGDYRWVNHNQWLIIGEIEKDDVFSPFYKMMMIFLGAFIIVLVLGLSIIFWLSKRLDRFSHQIIEGTHQMQSSNYDYRIEQSSYDQYPGDLQKLCITFNEMAEMIQFQMHSVHKSEEQYRSVVANIKEVIFHTDAEGIWTFLNPAWEEITGYSIEESIGILS